LHVQLLFILTFDILCPIQFPFCLLLSHFIFLLSLLFLLGYASRGDFRRVRAGISKLWSGAHRVRGCKKLGLWVGCHLCRYTPCLLHALGSPLRGVASLPCVLACPRRLAVRARCWLVGNKGVVCSSRAVTRPSGFGYQPSMNATLISSQQFRSPAYLSSHHACAGLFLFSWCRNSLAIDSGATMHVMLTKSSSHLIMSSVPSPLKCRIVSGRY
jgi:hypothetical protein